MSYVTSYGGGYDNAGSIAETLGNVVPGWGFAGRKLKASSGMATKEFAMAALGIAAGLVAILLMVSGIPVLWGQTGWSGMANMGASKSGVRSDSYAWQGSPNGADTFVGGGVGPEFVEQPNYVLGQEDLQRAALGKYHRLKAQGAAVGSWKSFYAAYLAENGDDLDTSMYDFGDSANTSYTANKQWDKSTHAKVSGFEGGSLTKSMLGR